MSLWPSQLRAGLHGNRCYSRPSHCQAAGLHSSRRHIQRPDSKRDDCAFATWASCKCIHDQELATESLCGEAAIKICSSGNGISRRTVLASLSCLACAISPVTAQAAIPEILPSQSAGLAERLGRALPLPFPMVTPEPVRFPRKPLDQRFAVLLMRSTYDAVDQLDFIPRQSFEAKFWKWRQSELEGYNYLYDPLKMRQGDLTDPLYFDFISFSQYATISREMQRPAKVFEEYYEVCPASDDDPCESGTKVVKRQPQYDDDLQLPKYFFNTTGDLIYKGLRDGFRGEVFGGPPAAPPAASIQQLAASVQQLLSIMADKGYALKASVANVKSDGSGSGGSFTISLQGPCNLWGMSALGARRSLVVNAFDVMVTDAYLRASGKRGRFSLQLTDAGLEEQWTVA